MVKVVFHQQREGFFHWGCLESPAHGNNEKHFSVTFSTDNTSSLYRLHSGADHSYHSYHSLSPPVPWQPRQEMEEEQRKGRVNTRRQWCVLGSKWRDIQGEERGRMVHMLLRGRWVDVREMSCIQERKGIGAGKFLSRIPFVNRAREIGYNPGGKERGFSPLPLLWWEKDDRNILL